MSLTGIILSGGKSRRMGSEKGLCLLKGKPLIEYSVDLLKNICDSIMISSNSNDYKYLGYQIVQDEEPGKGPAGGIYTCLKVSADHDNFIISCDTPLLTEKLVRYILSQKNNFDAVVPTLNGFPEPLCAYYRKTCLPVFGKSIETGQNKIQEIIKELNCGFIQIKSNLVYDNTLLFTNVNTPADLMRLEMVMSKNPHAHG